MSRNKELILTWKPRMQKIKAYRKLVDLADYVGISAPYLSDIMAGRRDPKALRHVDLIENTIKKWEKDFERISKSSLDSE